MGKTYWRCVLYLVVSGSVIVGGDVYIQSQRTPAQIALDEAAHKQRVEKMINDWKMCDAWNRQLKEVDRQRAPFTEQTFDLQDEETGLCFTYVEHEHDDGKSSLTQVPCKDAKSLNESSE